MDRSGALQAGLKEGQALWNEEEPSVNKTGQSRERCCTTGHKAVKKKREEHQDRAEQSK